MPDSNVITDYFILIVVKSWFNSMPVHKLLDKMLIAQLDQMHLMRIDYFRLMLIKR